MNTMLSEILFDTAYLFIITGSFIALIFGLSLIFIPALTLKLNEKINTRVSLREKTKKIETPIKTEPFFYKHAKISGIILVAGSLFVLYTLATFNFYSLIPYLPQSIISPPAWEWLLDAGQIFFIITCTFILIFGLIVLIRPSQIKKFEETANRWISTRQRLSKMSNEINTANNLVNTHPRIFGSFITVFSLIVLFLLLPEL